MNFIPEYTQFRSVYGKSVKGKNTISLFLAVSDSWNTLCINSDQMVKLLVINGYISTNSLTCHIMTNCRYHVILTHLCIENNISRYWQSILDSTSGNVTIIPII